MTASEPTAPSLVLRLRDLLRRLPTAGRVELALAPAVLLYGALLRFEAFQRTYGPVLDGAWFVGLQSRLADIASAIHPSSLQWARGELPFRYDAKSYLDSARAMQYFYEARVREPLFVFATKVGLWLTGGQDIAVSMMSSLSSWLVVPATYALGREIGGVAVALPAALLVAIEPDLISMGTQGYRDDLFSALFVSFAWAVLRAWRRRTLRSAVLAGVIGALACLTRITALSFLVPALFALTLSRGLGSWREMAKLAAVAAIITATLTGPFLITCWVQFGDPLYSISWHTGYYRSVAGLEGDQPMGASEYLLMQFGADPAQTLDTAIRGLTSYPWSNKWTRLGRHWGRPFALALSYLCILGVLTWLWSPRGRMLLLTLVGALLPYAFTWELRAGAQWRFTAHAYPLFLLAAVVAVVAPLRWAIGLRRSQRPVGKELRTMGLRLGATALVLLAGVGFVIVLSPIDVYHDLARGQAASVGGDERDAFFFGTGWYQPRQEGNLLMRYVKGRSGSIRVALPGGRSYRCQLRLQALTDSQSRRDPEAVPMELELTINGDWTRRIALTGPEGQVGRYDVEIPAEAIRDGLNRFDLRATWPPPPQVAAPERARRQPRQPQRDPPPTSRESAFKLWYLRFFPEG